MRIKNIPLLEWLERVINGKVLPSKKVSIRHIPAPDWTKKVIGCVEVEVMEGWPPDPFRPFTSCFVIECEDGDSQENDDP